MAPEHTWDHGHACMSLARGSVHVWRARLEEESVHRLFRFLSPDEKGRAERFHHRVDRHRFIIARAALRKIIGNYLHLEPERLRFGYSRYGKPRLSGCPEGTGFQFNLAHSQDLALYAFSIERKVGIDVEYVRPDLESLKAVPTAFSVLEAETLKALPEDLRTEAFFNCWTRKEAYIKAKGKGLSIPLDAFDVSLLPGEPPRLMNVRGDPLEASRWSLMEISPGRGYTGALAIEGDANTPFFWEWSLEDA